MKTYLEYAKPFIVLAAVLVLTALGLWLAWRHTHTDEELHWQDRVEDFERYNAELLKYGDDARPPAN